jgi:DNA-binding NarL/FixJ family response regulator
MNAIRITILDAQDISRSGLQMLLTEADAAFEVVGTFADLHRLNHWLQSNETDFLIVNDELPHLYDVGQIIKDIKKKQANLLIIVLSPHLNVDYIQRLLQAGAMGFVYKEDKLVDKLHSAIRTIQAGELYLSPKASTLPYTLNQPKVAGLTTRDFYILKLISEGLQVQEIATRLGLEASAVYRSRNRLRRVLGVRTSEQIVAAAIAQGLLQPLLSNSS